FFRQPRNVGHVRNFNTCLERARGCIVHLLHGDDLVLPGFYERMGRALEEAPHVGAAFCRYIAVNADGHHTSLAALERPAAGTLEGWLELIASGQRLQPPAMVVRRDVYERLGGFDSRISCYGEDWEMWVRIAAHYPVWYEPEPLAAYRVHNQSLTARGARTGAHAADYRKVIAINRSHLPPGRADEWSRAATVSFARACMRRGWRAVGRADISGASAHFREGIRTSRSRHVFAELVEHCIRLGVSASTRVVSAVMPW